MAKIKDSNENHGDSRAEAALTERQRKLSEALRDNLRRRRAQSHSRSPGDSDPDSDADIS